jgi:hypothetical protein
MENVEEADFVTAASSHVSADHGTNDALVV